jgi:hypothetical protein
MSPQRGEGDWDFRRLMLLALGLAAGVGTFALLVVLRCTTSWGGAPSQPRFAPSRSRR